MSLNVCRLTKYYDILDIIVDEQIVFVKLDHIYILI